MLHYTIPVPRNLGKLTNLAVIKHLKCRCLDGMALYPQTQLSTIPQTQQLQMHVYRISVHLCTMQCLSYAIRSQSVLTIIQLGVSTVFSTAVTCIRFTTSEIASIACLHDFSGPVLLSCSKIITYQLLGSKLWIALPLEKSRSPATVNKVSKSRHTKEVSNVEKRDNIEFYFHC